MAGYCMAFFVCWRWKNESHDTEIIVGSYVMYHLASVECHKKEDYLKQWTVPGKILGARYMWRGKLRMLHGPLFYLIREVIIYGGKEIMVDK